MPLTVRRLALLAAALAVTVLGLPGTASAAGRLPALHVGRLYVTGISSGGYMATQLQVAYSRRWSGAAVFSAGPYWCAKDSLAVALESCTDDPVPPDMPAIYAQTATYARQGKIDPTSNLARIPTYFFHGTRDTTVKTPVADDLAAYYRHYRTPLTYRNARAAGHAWISPLGPVPCANTAAPYINHCRGYDAEADLLRVMFGSVKAPNRGAPRGTLRTFSQDPYAVPPAPGNGDVSRSGARSIGMGSIGYVYVPSSCAAGARCAVVVALHGCLQTAGQIGSTFARKSGLSDYADTNRFVVLYPQARADDTFGNPKGCWDWWGYLGPNDTDYANQRGPQMRTVMNEVAALAG